MITPGLYRRSLRRGLRWRVLLLWWAALAIPGAIASAPAFAFLSARLGHSPRAPEVVAWMDGSTLIELIRQLEEGGASRSLLLGLASSVLVLLVCSPYVAGAMVASARTDEPLPLGILLARAGELYGRMLRVSLFGLVPLAVGGGLTAGIVKLVVEADRKALTETSANRVRLAGACAAALVLFLSHLWTECARAQFAADPDRHSAIAALLRGVRVMLQSPWRAIAVGALGTVVGLGLALGLMALRLQIAQSGAWSMALAWLLAQAAQVAIGWGRSLRIEGLAELSRAAAAVRARQLSPVPPPTPGAPEPLHSTPGSTPEPPPSGAAR